MMGSASFRSGSAESTQAPSASVERTATADRIRLKAPDAIEWYEIMLHPPVHARHPTMDRRRGRYHNLGWPQRRPNATRKEPARRGAAGRFTQADGSLPS